MSLKLKLSELCQPHSRCSEGCGDFLEDVLQWGWHCSFGAQKSYLLKRRLSELWTHPPLGLVWGACLQDRETLGAGAKGTVLGVPAGQWWEEKGSLGGWAERLLDEG